MCPLVMLGKGEAKLRGGWNNSVFPLSAVLRLFSLDKTLHSNKSCILPSRGLTGIFYHTKSLYTFTMQ